MARERNSMYSSDCNDYRPWFVCPSGVDRYPEINIYENIRIRDSGLYDTRNYYTSDFMMTHTNGNSKYVLVQPNGNTIMLSERTTGVHPLTSISGLPPDTYFKLTVDNGMFIYGKTSRTGTLDLDTSHIALNTPHHGGMLTLYVDALTSAAVSPTNVDLGEILFDTKNGAVLLIGTDTEAHAPFVYATVPVTDGMLVSGTHINGTAGKIYLPYLDGLYLERYTLWVPKVSGFDSVGTEFDSSPVNMRSDDLQLT